MTKKSAKRAASERLEVLGGVGPATAQALAQLGVSTIKQLARASPERLATRLRIAGYRASPQTIEGWVAEASARSAIPARAVPRADDECRALHPPEDLLEGWTAGPGFTVWFLSPADPKEADVATRHTIVYSEKGPGPMRRFVGTEDWVDWVREEAGLEPKAAVWRPPATTADTAVTLSDVAVSRRAGLPPAILVDVAFVVSPGLARPDLQVTTALVPAGADEEAVSVTQAADRGEDGAYRALCALFFPAAGRYDSKITIGTPAGVLDSFNGPEVTVLD